jgi:hypothetical protein
MFREQDYRMGDEPTLTVEVAREGCTWAGCLYERKTGGFDLFYDHQNSEFKPLEIDKITTLRHLVERGQDLVAHLQPERNQEVLLQQARKALLSWISNIVG